MKKFYQMLLVACLATASVYAQTDVQGPSGGYDPLGGGGSWLRFQSGGSTHIIEQWGLNITGDNMHPVKIKNASLLVGYPAYQVDMGVGNAFINGKVGIGTNNSNVALTVQTNTAKSAAGERVNILELKSNEDYANSPFKLEFDLFSHPDFNKRVYSLNTSDHGIAYGGNLVFQQYAGKVGIGTSDPDETLTVKGGIHARNVKVDLNGPLADYVFETGYKLRSLTDLHAYIKRFHHLPEVPSAKEAQSNGLDLGTMNQLLLQKVEELTLYVIEQNKRLSQQEKKISQLLHKQKKN